MGEQFVNLFFNLDNLWRVRDVKFCTFYDFALLIVS